MRQVWGRRTAAVAAVACFAISGIEGTGAQAPPPPPSCPAADPSPAGPIITFASPSETEPADTAAEATVTGVAEQRNGRVDCVLLTLSRAVPGQPQLEEVARRVSTIDADDPQPWPIEPWAPFLPYNDTYRVAGVGVGTTTLGPRTGTTAIRQFRSEIPPAPPTGLKVGIDQEKREASLTWAKNPEADIVGYLVQRAPAEGPFGDPKLVRDATSFVDDLKPLEPGEYRYRVTAARRKSQNPADENEAILSPAPAEAKATLRGEPTATTTSSPPTTRRTTATTARPARNRGGANRVDLRRFGGATSTIPDGATEPEDGEFGNLDFGERQDGRTDMTITELGQPVTDDGDERPTTLLFFAGGLLAFVVLMQLRWLKNEVDRVPLEEIPPEG